MTTVAGWIVVGVIWRFGATCTLDLLGVDDDFSERDPKKRWDRKLLVPNGGYIIIYYINLLYIFYILYIWTIDEYTREKISLL